MSPRAQGQETLTRERIVATALHIVDAEGLGALSMRRLGTELGVDASTIYYHVPNKAALFDLVVDAVMLDMDLEWAGGDGEPRERLLAGAAAFRDALLAHANALPLVIARPLRTPHSLRPVERMLGVFREAGLDNAAALAAVNAVGNYVLGASAAYAAHVADGEYHQDLDAADIEALPEDEFPHVRAAITEAAELGDAATADAAIAAEFDTGLRALVNGLLSGAAGSGTGSGAACGGGNAAVATAGPRPARGKERSC